MRGTGNCVKPVWGGNIRSQPSLSNVLVGPAGAVTATAPKLAIVLKNREAFHDRDLALGEERVSRDKLTRLRKQAARMDFELVPKSSSKKLTEPESVIE
jgi:hypothetical protein